MLNKARPIAFKYIMYTLGALLYSAGTSLFLDPNSLAPGGIIGIAVILNHLLPVSTGIYYFLLNLPIAFIGIRKYGWKFMLATVYTIAVSALFTHFLAMLPPVTDDFIIASLSGAVLQGAGIGIVFRFGATTGGTDILVKVLKEKHRYMDTGTLFFMMDVIVVVASGFVFKDFRVAFYAFVTVMVYGIVMNRVLYGADEARLLYIISDNAPEIGARLLTEQELGVTYLKGKGAYTGTEKQVILCAARPTAVPGIEDIVRETDENAFMIITSAKEIYGEGHKNILEERL